MAGLGRGKAYNCKRVEKADRIAKIFAHSLSCDVTH